MYANILYMPERSNKGIETTVISASAEDVAAAQLAFQEAVKRGDDLDASRKALTRVLGKYRGSQMAHESRVQGVDESTELVDGGETVIGQLRNEHPEITDPYTTIEDE